METAQFIKTAIINGDCHTVELKPYMVCIIIAKFPIVLMPYVSSLRRAYLFVISITISAVCIILFTIVCKKDHDVYVVYDIKVAFYAKIISSNGKFYVLMLDFGTICLVALLCMYT